MSITGPDKETAARAQVEQGHTRLRISVSLATSPGAKLHLTALLVIWALGAAFAIVSLFLDSRVLGPAIVHVVWLIAGIPVVWAYTRFAIGREVITLSNGQLTISHSPLAFGDRQRYLLAKAKHFRADTTGVRIRDIRHKRNPLRWRGEQGMILFDYGLQPVRFGSGLSTSEARHLLKLIRESGFVEEGEVEV